MAPGADEALYEIHRHASGSHVIPHQEEYQGAATSSGSSDAGGGGVLSYLSLQGVSKLKERWARYSVLGKSRQRKRGDGVALFVSPNAEYVSVTVGNRIIILRKGDGYASPCGVYTSNDRITFFTNGAWLEAQGIFGVVDDLSTLYLIKENGELLARRTCDQLKLSSSIIDLVLQDASNLLRPGFYIFTSDCLVHRFDYTEEPESSLCEVPISTKDVMSAKTVQLPRSLSCIDYHQCHSLFVLVGDSNVSFSSSSYSECVNKVGPTEAALRALLSFGLCITDRYKFSELDNSSKGPTWDSHIIRLRLLRHRDMLETFLGINMGRYAAGEYSKFRSMPLVETAIALAESGKIGAFNLIFKRHPYTISSDILRVLSAIPETLAVQTYSQLLPGKSPPSVVILRDGDWVECEQMASYINNCPAKLDKIGEIKTEILVKHSKGFSWPSVAELVCAVIENGCGESPIYGLFKDLAEMIETAVHCIYMCSATNQWNTMSSILSKLLYKTKREKSLVASEEDCNLKDAKHALGSPVVSYEEMQCVCADILSGLGNASEDFYHYDSVPYEPNNVKYLDILEKRLKVAEGHVEVGRLFTYYQVPKPMHFFLSAHLDEKNVKQIIRLLLSKFGRRQPEYMLAEFIRGLLKAGKFSLARNYLGGTSAVSLSTEKAENLVIQAAREYFFSASTLSGNEIWKARECLNLLPNSKNVQAETDIIDALTVRLPYLGVTILPVQFRQVKDPMEIICMVITSQTGAYLHFEEIIDVAKLLGLRSEEEVADVEEAIAREAVVNGDVQLALDICLNLTKKSHGAVWDLCAAIARGPPLDNLDTDVYPEIDGYNKERLSYIYGILSACHSYLKRTNEIELRYPEHVHTHKLEPFQYYKVLEEECKKVCFIDGLNYKNIAGLDNLNFEHFNEEVCKNIHASTVTTLADMVQSLVSMYVDVLAKGLISQQGVYKHYVLGLLASLEGRSEAQSNCTDYEKLQAALCEVELNYDSCREYIQALPTTDISYIVGRYCTLCFPSNLARSHPQEPSWRKPLATLLAFWSKLVDDVPGDSIDACSYERTDYLNSNRLSLCIGSFQAAIDK
ncbi:unnamed protein product [Miscanthus lutarioriparius]|uniref:Sec39 domain-containing protein n=1 Tax=Miscanthus lutarioriparius TaxID=422564 RepID=A0A811NYX6_9POAL|nr:unnamed protein product [Miscanthus lutarioriparius]